MSLFSTMFLGGYGCNMGNSCGFPTNTYNKLFLASMMQTMLSRSLFGGGFGFGTPGIVPQQTTVTTQHEATPDSKTIKQQLDIAVQNYQDLVGLCTKVEKYKQNTTTKLETLNKTKLDAEASVLACDKTISDKLAELKQKQSDPLLSKKSKLTPDELEYVNGLNKDIQKIQADIQKAEREKAEAQEEVKEATIDIDAFNLAQKGNEAKYQEVISQKDAAYKQVQELTAAKTAIECQEASQRAAAHQAAQDDRASGKWWNRSKLNPKNWTNLNFKGETDNSANVAKCLRKLKADGRDAALQYAQNHNLIKIKDNKVTYCASGLEDLASLYDGGYTQRKARGEV